MGADYDSRRGFEWLRVARSHQVYWRNSVDIGKNNGVNTMI